jgi:hypothetical protein
MACTCDRCGQRRTRVARSGLDDVRAQVTRLEAEIQDFPCGSGPVTPPGILMYVFAGMKISVISTGFCMLTMPREHAKPNAPVSVNETDMPCICVVVTAIRAAWPAVRVTAAARPPGGATFVPQPAARTPTPASTTRYLPPRMVPAFPARRREWSPRVAHHSRAGNPPGQPTWTRPCRGERNQRACRPGAAPWPPGNRAGQALERYGGSTQP